MQAREDETNKLRQRADKLRSEMARVLDDNNYANGKSPLDVTNKEYLALRMLSELIRGNHEYKMEDREKNLLVEFIKSAIGNMKLNHHLIPIIPQSYRDTGIDGSKVGQSIRDFSYRTRRLKQFNDSIFEKAFNLHKKIEAGEIPRKSERLSIGEFSILRDMAKLNDFFDELNKIGIIENDKFLQDLYKKIKVAHDIVLYFEKDFGKKFKFPPGAITFESLEKKSEFYNKSEGKLSDLIWSLISTFVTEFGHVTKGYSAPKPPSAQSDKKEEVQETKLKGVKDVEEEAKQIHINIDGKEIPDLRKEGFGLMNFLYNDVYVLKLEKLISNENKELLKQCYGANWLDEINSKYKNIESDLHDKDFQVSVTGDFQRIRSGALALASMHQFPGFIPISALRKPFTESPKEIHQQMFNKRLWQKEGDDAKEGAKMHCSEFVGRLTMAALVELNKQIGEDLKNKGIMEFKSDEFPNIIKIPFDPSESLTNLLPQRFLEILKEKDCVERLPGPPSLHKFVSIP